MTKKSIRQSIKRATQGLSVEETRRQRDSVNAALREIINCRKPSVVALFSPLPDEVDTHAFIDRWCSQKEIILPTVVGDDLELHRYTGPDCLTLGSYGILEPSGELFTDFDRITLAVIPGMAFDQQGNRLGRGKGYYDRLLPCLPRAYKLGLCFPFQLLTEEIPHESHDCRMDEVMGTFR